MWGVIPYLLPMLVVVGIAWFVPWFTESEVGLLVYLGVSFALLWLAFGNPIAGFFGTIVAVAILQDH